MTTKDTPITVSRSDTTTTYENSELGIILAVIHYHKRQWCLTCYDSPDDIHLTEWVSRENAERVGLNHAHEVTDAINNGALARTGNDGGTAAAYVTHSVAQLREELADIYTRDLLSPTMYRRANQIIDRIGRLTGIPHEQIIADAKADADLLEADDCETDDPRCAPVTV